MRELGVTIQEVNQTLADSFKLDKPEGALVSSVEKGGPADKAGLQAGRRDPQGERPADRVLGRPAGRHRPGDAGEKVKLDVWREGKREQLSAKLGDASEKAAKVAKSDGRAPARASWAWRCGRCSRRRRRKRRHRAAWWSRTPAAQRHWLACSRATCCWQSMARRSSSVDQVREVVAKSDKSVALLIQRGGDKIFVPVRIG